MTIGYWIDPEGREIEAHESAPHTHAGKAAEILGGDAGDDPVTTLLRRGWVRVTCDVINVHGMDRGKRGRIARFLRRHRQRFEAWPTVFVEDDELGTSVRTDLKALCED
jgi:hypothetical protein